MISLKRLLKLFDVKLTSVAKTEHRNRWVNVMNALTKYDEPQILSEFNRVLQIKGKQEHPLYYMEAVRRNLLNNAHNELKADKRVPKSMRQLFKEMSL